MSTDDDWDDEDLPHVSAEIWEATLAFIQQHQPVTFTQLVRFLAEQGVPVEGNWAITDGSFTREYYWRGVSHEVVDLVLGLDVCGDILNEATTSQTYLEESDWNSVRVVNSERWALVVIVAGYTDDE